MLFENYSDAVKLGDGVITMGFPEVTEIEEVYSQQAFDSSNVELVKFGDKYKYNSKDFIALQDIERSIGMKLPDNAELSSIPNIDKETDVLSFPMFEREELDKLVRENETQLLQDVMGDIIISIERVEEQAKEYGHGFEREFAYMLVHGFYHLRGYDHITDEQKKEMREKRS